MPDLPDVPGKSPFLSRKILGVQVLYWLAIGVLLLAYLAYRMRNASEDLPEAAEQEPDELAPENADESAGLYDGFAAQPTPTYSPGIGSTTTVETNDSWAKKAAEFVGASGLASYGNAQLVIQKYLNGDQLTFEEGKIRDLAIKQFGLPPEPITAGGTGPEAPRRQGTPPTYHTVKGSQDNDYSELIRLYWGEPTSVSRVQFKAANATIGAGPYPVGTRVFIPAYQAAKYFIVDSRTNMLSEIAKKFNTTIAAIRILNPGITFTNHILKPGTRVRVG
jgi:hypothetical protein